MTSPPTSEEVPKKDKPKTTIDLPIESPIHIITTPLHSSISSDLGSSAVMVSSIVCDEDDSKTPSPNMSVDVESPSRTVILSFAHADAPDSEDTRQVIEEVVPAMVPSQCKGQKDVIKQDTKDNKDQGIGLGLSILDDPPQDEDDVALQTAVQLLSLSGQKEELISQLEALDPKGRYDDHTPTGRNNDGRMPGGLAGIALDDRPYPPVSVVPSYSTVSSATATSGLASVPSYSSSTFPSASGGSSEGVHMIPPQADLPEVDRQQETGFSDILQNFQNQPEMVSKFFHDHRHAQAQHIQAAQQMFPGLHPGIQSNVLGDQPVSSSESATSDFYRPYADGTQPFDPVENQAHLQAQHQARVANIQVDKDNRAKVIRARLEKDALAALQKEKDDANKGEGVASGTVPGMTKGLAKQPPKRKSAGARIMALRASKPAHKDAPGMSRFDDVTENRVADISRSSRHTAKIFLANLFRNFDSCRTRSIVFDGFSRISFERGSAEEAYPDLCDVHQAHSRSQARQDVQR